ncbi:uncharacterized protein BO72DRAFT_208103 [Aspergillus fijiensis CBS 313.89]|uniref:Uncharacterized protein n=1 Tax=Aspergillus fijiensis CBS 313.89 TaxID=1448319 RepID=A0A8G1RYP6_9EURO|nr:uncharacterized protein BO72DRAFT_208103 [Aspergillus fijiensis CBS 313.89]RAK81448.1 hypothetical protein BO72DRAFT_208103 [Aspergillus fijiensis CBS 313.89]
MLVLVKTALECSAMRTRNAIARALLRMFRVDNRYAGEMPGAGDSAEKIWGRGGVYTPRESARLPNSAPPMRCRRQANSIGGRSTLTCGEIDASLAEAKVPSSQDSCLRLVRAYIHCSHHLYDCCHSRQRLTDWISPPLVGLTSVVSFMDGLSDLGTQNACC